MGLDWNGAIGYGCGSVSSLASTWLTVTSTVVSFGTETTTAVVPTFSANQFVFSSAPSAPTGFTFGYTATASGCPTPYRDIRLPGRSPEEPGGCARHGTRTAGEAGAATGALHGSGHRRGRGPGGARPQRGYTG